MAEAKLEVKVGALLFSGEGDGKWLSEQLDKVLGKIPELANVISKQRENVVDEKILLVEYEKAQDSAEHHDQLLWVVAGLLFTGMAGLLAIKPGGGSLWMRFYPPGLGIVISVLAVYFVHSFRSFRKQKYDRCVSIETKLGMEQHSKLKSPKPGQVYVVYSLSGIFLLVWILRLCWEWNHIAS